MTQLTLRRSWMRYLFSLSIVLTSYALSAAEIIAHRGASHEAPENTLSAMRLGWQQADACELDIRLTKDGQIVLLHDADLKRTTGLKDLITQRTVAELVTLDAGSWKDKRFAGERIPILADVLAAMPAGKRLLVEIKCGSEVLPELERVINSSGKKSEQLAIIGFSFDTMKLAKERFPNLQVLWVVGNSDGKNGKPAPTLEQLTEKAKAAGFDGLDLEYKFPLTADSVARIKAAGLKVYVWTVNDPAVGQRLVAAGVDGVTTDKPQLMAEKLARP